MNSPSKIEDRFEIQKVLVSSTAHVSKDDYDMLNSSDSGWVVSPYTEGCYVYMGDPGDWDEVDCFDQYSYAFKKLIALTRQLKCTHLRLDSDGEKYAGLEKFDW